MASAQSSNPPNWLAQPPSAFDIIATRFPETKPKGRIQLRPCLVLEVLKGKTSGSIALRMAFGTKNLKFAQRQYLDLIIQNAADLNAMGLPMATRFDLDARNVAALPWTEEFFGCWTGYPHPKIARLPDDYVKSYLYLMALRQANEA